tara:strand:+ start:2907 stop:3542 length:636 start_codon:yes stop_codon:yes gene_type:complete
MISNKKKALIGRIILNLIYSTNIRIVNGRNNFKSEINNRKSVILCVWHAHLLSIVYDLKKFPINALAGTHRDADIISEIALKWGWKMIRGSSKENGDIAYRKIYRLLKRKGEILFITPDGPTGPPRIPKLGIIRAAQKTGASIIPIGVFSTKNWGFTNWDTFYLEKPFGKIFIDYGTPFNFSNNINSEKCKKILIKKMNDIEKICFKNAHK